MQFLVKLSQNKKIIVPVVALVAIGIFGSSYLIQNNRTVARQEFEKASEESASDTNNTLEVESIEQEPEKQETPTEDKESEVTNESVAEEKLKSETSEVEVEVEYENTTVIADVSTDKEGLCYIIYKSDDGEQVTSEPVKINNGICKFEDISASGKINVKYNSNDGTLIGIGSTN